MASKKRTPPSSPSTQRGKGAPGPAAPPAGSPSAESKDNLSDETNVASVQAPPSALESASQTPPSGVLKPPPDVEVILWNELQGQSVSTAFRQRLASYLTLRYYYGGQHIAYRLTADGPEVLAIGLREMADLNQRLSPAERSDIIVGRPEPW
jgi:hypothetical protein